LPGEHLRLRRVDQGRSGLGPAAQRHEIEAFASREGITVESWTKKCSPAQKGLRRSRNKGEK
jgi:hypothetical protein